MVKMKNDHWGFVKIDNFGFPISWMPNDDQGSVIELKLIAAELQPPLYRKFCLQK